MGLIEEFEETYWEHGHLVIGIDEAGRGPMAGPLVVSGVVFPIGYNDERINDSKKLSAKKRDELVSIIMTEALWTQTIIVDVETIDTKNIYKATQDAMRDIANEAIVTHVLTDAMTLVDCIHPHTSIVKGDQRSISIAAASILAKTRRDEIMLEIDEEFPQYGFKNHKGYGTKKHKESISEFGRCIHHRNSFKFKDES